MKGRFPSLDGLRALAVIPVVWHHATPGPLGGALDRGPLGVDLFFTLSGFLITTLLLRERARSGGIALGAFYVRRSLRIFPLYYVVLGAFVLHALFLRAPGPTRDHFLHAVPLHATYLTNWLVDFDVGYPVVFAFAWSLAAEEQFYLVWPWILRIRGLLVPTAFMIALVVLDQAAERSWLGLDGLPLRMLRSIATPICLGALLALALASRRGSATLGRALAWRWSAPLAFVALAACVVVPSSLFTAHVVMVLLVGACAAASDHHLRWLTDARAARHVGDVSYGIYLLNVPVVVATRDLLGLGFDPHEPMTRTLLVFAVALGGTTALATLTQRLVERPFLALRDRFRLSDRTPSPDTGSAGASSP
jgi:peptidoglycan/LPS O-acetylase OafA/YrhL